MSKMKKMFVVSALALSLGFVSAPTVSAHTVVKSYYYDYNFFFTTTTNYFGYQYIDIPGWSRFSSSENIFVKKAWNFTRYQRINYYTGGY